MFTNATDAAEYATAGNAKLTLLSRRSGVHYTYKISAPKDAKKKANPILFVSLLSGPDNEADFTYLGIIRNDEFKLTAKSRMNNDSKPVLAFRYFIKHCFLEHVMPPELEVRHEGTCGRCGRTLTVPESIDRGIGPECIKHAHIRSYPKPFLVVDGEI